MAKIEILCYSPLEMPKFLDYFVNGLKDENGKYLKDEYDQKITGVIAWLHGRGVKNAHFFSSGLDEPVKLFLALIEPKEPIVVPWMTRIPFFSYMVTDDGIFGSAPDFSTVGETPLALVKSRPDLDAIFKKEQEKVDKIDFSRVRFNEHEFRAALQGKGLIDISEILSDLESTHGIRLLENTVL